MTIANGLPQVGMKYTPESDEHLRSTIRSFCWTVLLVLVFTVALASAV
jgi:hypothetical protein